MADRDEPRPYTRGQLAGLRKKLREQRSTSEKRRLLATVEARETLLRQVEQTLASVAECSCEDCRRAASVLLAVVRER